MLRTTSRFELSVALVYLETTIPPGLTTEEYGRSRPQRRSRWHRLWRGAGSGKTGERDWRLR